MALRLPPFQTLPALLSALTISLGFTASPLQAEPAKNPATQPVLHPGTEKLACVQCHDMFRDPKGTGNARASCVTCHQQKKPVAFTNAPAHQKLDCAECHRPHAVGPLGGVPNQIGRAHV